MFICKCCGLKKTASEYRIHKRGHRIGKCRECERAYQSELMKRDPEKYRKRKRESMAKRRAADPEAARAYRMAYHSENRDAQIAKMRNYYARRFFWGRAMKLRGQERASASNLAKIWKTQRGKCAVTGRKLGRDAQIDHIIPRAKGGTDDVNNLRWLCPEANYAKRDMADVEFIALCEDVMSWIGQRIDAALSRQKQ